MMLAKINGGYDTFTGFVKDTYEFFAKSVDSAIDVLTKSSNQEVINNFQYAVKGMALSIVGLLFFIDFLTVMLDKGEDLRWTDGIRIGIKGIIAKQIASWASLFVTAIYGLVSNTITKVGTTNGTNLKEQIAKAGTQVAGTFVKGDGIDVLAENLSKFVMNFPTIICILAAAVIVLAMAYARWFEIQVLTAVSPIAYAFVPYKGTTDVVKRFTLNFGAVCIQALVMLLCIKLYLGLQTEIYEALQTSKVDEKHFRNMSLVYSILLVFSICSSGKWAKNVLGQ